MADCQAPDEKQERKLLRELAHEVCTPLNAMMGYSELLKKGVSPEPLAQEQVFDYAERINTASRRLLQICERVLDEAVGGEGAVHKEDVDFRALCPEIVRTFEADAKARGVTLDYAIVDDFPVLFTDPVLLYEILSNLISNAIKFTPKGGTVTVKGEVDYKNNGLILVVRDTGKGIPAAILMKLMKGGGGATTSQLHADRKGWGLGLRFVQEKAELLGGALEIESASGGGTVACIRMPQKE